MAVAAIIIVVCTCILYVLEIFPVAVTTMLGLLAMIFSGVLTAQEGFAGFASTPVMLVIGMVIITDALLECGMSAKIGAFMSRFMGKSEKRFVIYLFIITSILSLFLTNSALVAMFMPLIAAIAAGSNGRITKKNTYLTLATGGLIGGTGSLIGSTAPLLANNVLKSVGVETMGFFEPLKITACIIVVMVICYALFLYKLQVKCFDFDEVADPSEQNADAVEFNKRKAIITLSVFFICVVLFIIQPFKWDLGLIALAGAMVLIVTKCVDGKKAMKNMFWPALVTLGAALGIASGFVKAGVGELTINWLVGILGDGVANPLVLITIFLVSGYILSLFMSNGSLVAMLSAIAIPMAVETGCNPMALAMACVFGASLAMATPAATTSVTMVQVAGYRFKDYFRIGGLTGVIGLITSWVAIVLLYVVF